MNDQENFEGGDRSAIAVVGMACHLPGAANISEYWNNLRAGVESVRRYTDEELLAAGESPSTLADPNYVNAQPFLEGFDRFDAKFWGFSPQDAAVTDPAHRIFLEVSYQALEHAGHTGYDSEGTVAAFATSGASQYWMNNLNSNPQLIDEMGEFLVRHTGNDMNFLATRFSYELDLRGPSLNIQTACSSALVSVHMAVQSLLGGECDTAVVGGSTVLLPQGRGYLYRESEIMSPDGHCRPFDAKSAGTIFGSGAGSVVLRRLEDALEDGDTIYAVIHGSAINNDGAQKVGYLAPGVEGQAGVVAEALEISGINAEDISYIEAHGTGTLVGDPIEFEALNQVYREATAKRDYCRVGSVKSNIGHLGEAAGAAALIKVILALQHKQLPPSINYESPNQDIDLDDSPFLINDTLVDWDTQSSERLAGVTALGAGGTNAHLIIGEAPEPEQTDSSNLSKQLIVVSAKTDIALNAACRNLAAAIREQTDLDLADIAYTLQIGRRAYAHRRVLAAGDREEAIHLLEGGDAKRVANATAEDRAPSLVLMFPGGGAQYADMGAELYETESVYKRAFDSCLQCLEPQFATEIRSLVFAGEEQREQASKALERPSRTLPSLFATEFSLAKQLMSWGAEPAAFIGHSMGEYTAACLAGVISVKDAMSLVFLRGQLFEKVSSGGMLSISLSESEARTHMRDSLDIAAVNAADLCVASGPVEDIEHLQVSLEESEIDCMRVRIDVAAHSSMLEPILDEFRTFCESIQFSPPEIPFTSNLSGDWITDEQATDPNYWVQHLRNTVRFADNIATVLADDSRVLVEIGPGRTLTNLAQAGEVQALATFNAMRHVSELDSDVEYAMRTYGHIWAAGVELDWRILWGEERRRRVALPTYPFERKAYWVDPGVTTERARETSSDSLEKRSDIADWFAQYNWAQSGVPMRAEEAATSWLFFEDEVGVSNSMVEALGEAVRVIRVQQGDSFAQLKDDCFSLAANSIEQFERLFQSLSAHNHAPVHIVYLWPVTSSESYPGSSLVRLADYERHMETCFWGLFNLSKVLSELEDTIRLTVVSSDMHAIGNLSCPEKAMLAGPVSVLPHELLYVRTQSIDVSPSSLRKDSVTKIASQVMREICSMSTDRFVAYRGTDRWVRRIESQPLEARENEDSWLRSDGTYLISGGLGGIGLTIAHHLATLGAGTLILLGRRGLPERAEWQRWLDEHVGDDSVVHQIKEVQKIELLGARVLPVSADVTDFDKTKQAIEIACDDCGPIHGVIHAAGSMDDQLILLKPNESARMVIDAKVKGALVLDSITAAESLDFFVVFSSVASYLGLPGQIDYNAANAFLDAFAIDRAQRASGESIAINWNAWREIGMAAEVQHSRDEGEDVTAEMHSAHHPVLHHYVNVAPTKRLFSTKFSVEEHWLLAEHRTKKGGALIPGTGFIELIRAAFFEHCLLDAATDVAQNACIELSDVQFLTPFQVADKAGRTLHIDIDGTEQRASLSVYSDAEDLPHALGNAALLTACETDSIDIAALRERCKTPATTQGKFLDQDFMNFGPRWGCIKSIQYGSREALLDIELPKEFATDLDDFKLHPALLDMATGGVQFLIDGFSKESDFYVPVAYESVRLYNAMPSHFFSHVRIGKASTADFALFDVTLMDDYGKPFADITGFTMKKVVADFGSSAESHGSRIGDGRSDSKGQSAALEEVLRHAILPAEGVEAFDRVMTQNNRAQWIVSSVDSELWLRQLDTPFENQQQEARLSYVREDIHDPDADEDIVEIEQALLRHQALEQVFVRSFLDEGGSRRLMAYFLPDDYEQVTVSDLRKYARTLLSADKVPQQFIELDEAPLDEQGAIDRAQLTDPLAPEDTYAAPCTSTEKELAKIWQDILGVDRVGLSDNFFDIGGHSLLSIRIIVRVDKKLGVRLDQTTMAMHTLEQIASEIDEHHEGADVSAAPKPEPTTVAETNENKEPKNIMEKFFGRK